MSLTSYFTNRGKGIQGEDIAVKFFRSKGFSILERNYRTRVGEIDIIVTRGAKLVFVEVKTRTSSAFGLPQEAVTHEKQRKIRHVAAYYIQNNRLDNTEIRFDVIGVMLNGSSHEIVHIPGAF